jgi:hypothetical protein
LPQALQVVAHAKEVSHPDTYHYFGRCQEPGERC